MAEAPLKKKRAKSQPIDNSEDERVSSSEEDVSKIVRRKKAADQLPLDKAKFLQSLVIELRHQVLPQHQIERAAGSRVPSEEERKEFEKLATSMKKGVYNAEEDQIIVNNWKAFCKLHNWTSSNPKPFLFLRHHYHFYLPKSEERKKFVQFLADGLPNRTLYSVYHRFRNLHDPHKVMKYTYQEDEYIIRHIEGNKNVNDRRKFADLAKLLNRTRASVWRRYRLLKKKREKDSD